MQNAPLIYVPRARPFFIAGMVVMLSFGAAWGVLLLWKIAFSQSFTSVSVLEVNAHGHAQIMGWLGLFVMGAAYELLPCIWQSEASRRGLCRLVLIAMLLGICMRGTAMMFANANWAMSTHTVGVLLETISVLLFAGQILCMFRRSEQRLSPESALIGTALLFFVVQTVYSGVHVAALMRASSREVLLHQISTYQAPLRDMQIHGVALLMIFGMGMLLLPSFFGLAKVSVRRGWLVWGLLTAAVFLEVTGFILYRTSGNHVFAALLLIPWLMLWAGAGCLVKNWQLWRSFPRCSGEPYCSEKFVRVAFGWLMLSLTLLLFLPLYNGISGIAFSHAYYGAVRHAITVGFVSLMIVGMSSYIVPMVRGVDRSLMPRLWLPFVLINLGCALRVGFQIGTDWHPVFFKLVGISGILEWTGFTFWAGGLVACLFGLGRYRQTQVQHSYQPTFSEERASPVCYAHLFEDDDAHNS